MAVAVEYVCFAVLVLMSLLVQVYCATYDDDDAVAESEFDVKPGGVKHTVTEDFGDFVCAFTYVCQGGTNEKWEMTMTASHNQKHYSCSVQRPNGRSYLFFQSFTLEIQGADIVEAAAFVDLKTALKTSEYTINYKKGTVSEGKGFQSKLARVDIVASMKKKHSEL